jgi:O-antigen/teichoic acid export membrane protein
MAEAAVQASAGGRGSTVVRTSLLSMVGLVALGGTRLVHTALVSRATDSVTLGKVTALIGLAMTAALFLPGGLASAASRFIPFQRGAGDVAGARTAYRVLTLGGYACAIASGAVVYAISLTLPNVTTGDAVTVAALTAVYSAYSVAKGALYGFDRVVPYTWLEIAGSVVTVGATVIVVSSGSHAYLVPLVVGYAVLMLGSLLVLHRQHDEGGAAAGSLDRREMITYVGLASLGGVASAGLLQVLPALAYHFTTQHEVSYFGVAVSLVAPLYFLPRALGMALFPAMARSHGAGDVDVVRRHADVSTRALVVLLAPLFAAAVLLAPEALAIYVGTQYIGGSGVLRMILVATYVAVIQVAAVNALSSGNSVRIPVYSAVLGAVVGLAALIPLGHFFGATGVGLAYLIAVVIGAAGPLAVVWRRYRMAWTGPGVRSFALLAVAMVVAQLDQMRTYGTGRIVVDLVAAVVLVVAGLLLLRRDLAGVLAARRG